jgi:hypothetical protein
VPKLAQLWCQNWHSFYVRLGTASGVSVTRGVTFSPRHSTVASPKASNRRTASRRSRARPQPVRLQVAGTGVPLVRII